MRQQNALLGSQRSGCRPDRQRVAGRHGIRGVAAHRRSRLCHFPHEDAGPEAEEGTHFKLYDTYEAARDDRYTIKRDMIIEIKDSVRGLSVGAPVEFRGLQIGKVTDIDLDADFENLDFTVPVRIELEPERLHLPVARRTRKMRSIAGSVCLTKGFGLNWRPAVC